MAAHTGKPQMLQLALSENLSLFMTTTPQLMAVGSNIQQHISVSLIKEEIAQFAGQNVIKKAVIQLTLEEYFCLKTAFGTVDSIINFTTRPYNVKPSTATNNEGTQYSTTWPHLL